MRSLSPDEAALWAKVASTIRPLSREAKELSKTDTTAPPTEPMRPKSPTMPPALRVKPAVQPAKPAVGKTLDGSWDRRLSNGQVQPDRVVDLHGKSLDGAWRAIDTALEQAIARGDRLVLLITGHQRAGEPPIRRGAIRAAVHDWLAASRHAGDIAAVRAAHGRHGGGGSLYIILRKSRF